MSKVNVVVHRAFAGPWPLRQRGFSLVEISIVLVIAGLALAGILAALGPQLGAVRYSQTRSQLAEVSDAIVAFAMVNRRLPCPATATSGGRESFCTGGFGSACAPEVIPPANSVGRDRGRCFAAANAGFVPGATLGLPGLRTADSMIADAWSFPLRYVTNPVQNTTVNNPPVAFATPCGAVPVANTCVPFTQADGIRNAYFNPSVPPSSTIFVCATSTGIAAGNCGAATQLANPAFLVYSHGINGSASVPPTAVDELANTNADTVYVSHEKTETTAPNGGFDDLFHWVTFNQLLAKMTAGGVVP